MTDRGGAWFKPGQAWLLVALLAIVPAALIGWAPIDQPAQWPAWWARLPLRPEQGWQQPAWVWWSAAWVHGSARHWGLNLAGLAILAVVGWRLRLRSSWAAAWALSWPLAHLALVLDPRLSFYLGASALVHAGLAVVAVALWLGDGGRQRWVGLLLIAGLLLKAGHEAWVGWGAGPASFRWGADVPVAHFSHLSGVLSGLILAGIHGAARHR